MVFAIVCVMAVCLRCVYLRCMYLCCVYLCCVWCVAGYTSLHKIDNEVHEFIMS